ncbi:MAG TPA: PilZ domain-containing protein [Edaphobacter sp.]|nr:PilZ domain-containing protein [Edaphobacter sp.]
MSQRSKSIGDNPVRNAVRFPMRLAIHICTEEGDIEAMTENISANGLLFVSDRLPEIDSKIEFTITMPSAVMGSATDVTIHCRGRVVRHCIEGGEKKAAAVIDEYFLKA